MKEKKFYLILHKIRGVYNVGSMFQAADGIGINGIFVTGFIQENLGKY